MLTIVQYCCRCRGHACTHTTVQGQEPLHLAGILHGLQSSNWKERLTSMERLQQQVQDRKENLEGTNSILNQGMSYLPGWTEKNFQVICCTPHSHACHV